ncbi:MAG: AAA family ATPase [Clostridium sp.]
MEKKKQDREKSSILEFVSSFLSKIRMNGKDNTGEDKCLGNKGGVEDVNSQKDNGVFSIIFSEGDFSSREELISTADFILQKYKTRLDEQFNIKLIYDEGVVSNIIASFDTRRGKDGLETVIEDRIYSPIIDLKIREKINSNNIVSIAVIEGMLVATSDMDEIVLYSTSRIGNGIDEVNIDEELESIVGLRNIKDFITTIEDMLKLHSIRERQGIDNSLKFNMIFQGNPGTGKKTIARLIGRYLSHIGYLSKGTVTEAFSCNIIGEDIAQTINNINSLEEKSCGGVLVIGDIYTLNCSGNTLFIDEVISQLGALLDIEDRVVIFTGTSSKMEEFMVKYPELQNKIQYNLQFNDYNPLELMDILRVSVKYKGYTISEDAEKVIFEHIAYKCAEVCTHSGNGILVDNLLNQAILSYENRASTSPLMVNNNTLILEDFKI